MNRRSFLKRVGAATLAVVAAPLFIPSERLDFGVPSRNLALPSWMADEQGLRDEVLRRFSSVIQSALVDEAPPPPQRLARDLEWERGIERFMQSFGATEYRIDGMGGHGRAPMLTAEANSRLYLPDEIVIASDEFAYTLRDVIEGRA